MEIIETPSPNHNARPAGVRPDLIVIHGTAGKTDAGDLSWCRDPRSRVSYHYLIGRDGRIYRLVPDEQRAWHAGESSWEGRSNCNDYSIGVGLSNDGREPYTPAQYDAAAWLVGELMRRWQIPPRRVVGHCHVSPGRKQDPWLHFHWGRLFEGVVIGRASQ